VTLGFSVLYLRGVQEGTEVVTEGSQSGAILKSGVASDKERRFGGGSVSNP